MIHLVNGQLVYTDDAKQGTVVHVTGDLVLVALDEFDHRWYPAASLSVED